MKTSLLYGATLAILGLAAAPVDSRAQTTSTTTSSSTGYVQTSKIIGTRVKSAQGEEVGEIKDVVLDRNTGCMAYTVLSSGGTGTRIAGQAKTVAVPWAVYSTTSDPRVLTVRVDRDRIYNAPAFDYARIDEYSSSGWINNVYSYYGVSGQAGVGVGASVTGSSSTATGATSTGTSTSTSATATPMPTASALTAPRETATPATTAMPSATASASPAARASATASPRGTRGESATRDESPTRGESPSGRTRTGTSRHRGEAAASPSGTEESTAGATASPAGEHKKSSRRHATKGTTEPSASPKGPEEQE
jgi:sporulation protein YlmC with PRC-barrel domain